MRTIGFTDDVPQTPVLPKGPIPKPTKTQVALWSKALELVGGQRTWKEVDKRDEGLK